MGGANALRGFLVQTMIAVLDSLGLDDWKTVATEPDISAEKVDIIWTFPSGLEKVVQVKSTEVQISVGQAKKWARELSLSYLSADDYELILVGPCHEKVSGIIEHCGVKIPPAIPNNLDILLSACAYNVSSVLERKSMEPLAASANKSVASQLVTTFFINATKPISRDDLEQEVVDFIASTGHRVKEESDTIIRALTNQSIQSNREMLNQKKQIEKLEAAIAELQISSASSDLHEKALTALKQGDTSLADSLFSRQIMVAKQKLKDGTEELEQAYVNLAAINAFLDIDRSIEAYKQAADLNPNNSDYWLQLGILLLRKAEYELAEEVFDKYSALAIESDDGNLVFRSPR